MKNTKIIDIIRQAGQSAFRTQEYVALTQNPNYAHVQLHRLHQKDIIQIVRRGWWAFPDAMPEAVACEMSAPAYLSFHTALHLHGLTTQPYRKIQLAVARNAKKYAVLATPVQEYRVAKNQFRDYEKKDGLLIAKPEKALADALNVPRSCPEFIITEVLHQIEPEKIRPYLATTAAQKRLERLTNHA